MWSTSSPNTVREADINEMYREAKYSFVGILTREESEYKKVNIFLKHIIV